MMFADMFIPRQREGGKECAEIQEIRMSPMRQVHILQRYDLALRICQSFRLRFASKSGIFLCQLTKFHNFSAQW